MWRRFAAPHDMRRGSWGQASGDEKTGVILALRSGVSELGLRRPGKDAAAAAGAALTFLLSIPLVLIPV
jgi:hypothetical protein